MKMLLYFLPFLPAIIACTAEKSGTSNPTGAIKVEISAENGGYTLLRGDEPFFIKGAVGWGFLDELTEAGANSVRSSYKFWTKRIKWIDRTRKSSDGSGKKRIRL
jgi:hypothetical protein